MNKYNPETGLKRCCQCKQYRTKEEFPRNRSTNDGLNQRCRHCRNKKPIDSKICRYCGVRKHHSQFGKDERNKLGLSYYCQSCIDTYHIGNRINKRLRGDGLLRCHQCKQYLLPEAFHKDKNDANGRSGCCKNCHKEYRVQNAKHISLLSREYQKAHPEKRAAYTREYNKRVGYKYQRISSVKRMARKANLPNTLTNHEWQRALTYFNDCCAVCGRQLNNLFKSHTVAADHWIPLSKDGGTTALNIIPLCHGVNGCNNHKKDRLPSEWLAEEFGSRKANKILARIEGYFAWVKTQV